LWRTVFIIYLKQFILWPWLPIKFQMSFKALYCQEFIGEYWTTHVCYTMSLLSPKASFKQLTDLCWLVKNYKYTGMSKHIKRTEVILLQRKKNSVLCSATCWGTKYKEKHRQSHRYQLHAWCLIVMVAIPCIPCLDISDSEVNI